MENNEVAVIQTTQGEITLAFWPEVAPKTVENFKTLARKGFYDGTLFIALSRASWCRGAIL